VSFVLIDSPRPGVTLVTLNRPERMNAMAFDVMIPFREALTEVGRDNDTRVIVLTGAGRGFCSGADLEDPGTIPHIDGLTLPTIALRSMELPRRGHPDTPAAAPTGHCRGQRAGHRRGILPVVGSGYPRSRGQRLLPGRRHQTTV